MTDDEIPQKILIDSPVNAYSDPAEIEAWINKLTNGPYPDHPDVLRALVEARDDLKFARERKEQLAKKKFVVRYEGNESLREVPFKDAKKRIFRRKFVPNEQESVSLTVCCPEDGLMDARLIVGTDIFPLWFSDADSPFPEFYQWLKNLIAGERCEPIRADDEGREHFFSVSPGPSGDSLLFEYLRCQFPAAGVYRKALVNKRAFMLELYWVFAYLMAIDFESKFRTSEGYIVQFDFDSHTNEIIKFDLTDIERYLKITHKLLP